jgi:putative ABC transport system permease protein
VTAVGRLLRRKAWRDLRHRRAQLIAVAVTVGCGLALFASTYDAYRNLETSYRRAYDQLAFADLWVTGGDSGAVADQATRDPHVTAVETRIEADVPLQIGGKRLQGRVASIPVGRQPDVNRLLLSHGRYPDQPDEVVLEQHAADTFHLGVGDTVGVVVGGTPTQVRIAGVAASAEYLWLARSRDDIVTVPDDFAVVFAPEPLAQQMAPGGPRQVVLTVDSTASLRHLRAVADDAGATDVYDQAHQPSSSTLQIDIAGFGEMALMFPVLFLSAAGLAVYVLLGRVVQQDRPVIGALTANGVSRRVVMRHYATHAFAAVLAGAIPGLVVGSLLGGVLTGVYTSELHIPITATQLRPMTPLIGLAFALVTAGIVAVGPARAAARVLPAEALRPPTPPAGAGRTHLERLLPIALPTGARMAVRNLGRRPTRALGTAVGVALAAIVVVAAAGMRDSMASAVDRQFSTVDSRDLTAVLSRPADAAAVADLASIDGVEVAEAADLAQVQLAAGDATSAVELQLLEPRTAMHGFDHRWDGGLVVSSRTAHQLGVGIGDDLELRGADAAGRLPLVQISDEPLGDTAYLDLPTWRELGGPAPRAVSLRGADGADLDAIHAALDSRPGVVAVVDHAALAAAVDDLLGLFAAVIWIMVGFGLVLAIALVFNAIAVNVGERTTELATLRAAGIDRRRLHRWVLLETSTVVALALLPGLLVGRAVCGQLLSAVDTSAFHIDRSIDATTWLWVAALVLGASALAHLPAWRRVDRMDLAAVVRERQS